LIANAEKLPGSRVLDGRFMAIQQALGIPKARQAGATYLREFIEDVKASGFVAQAIAKAGIRGVSVAPPGHRID
jgi:polar amino acid transport system substrate-binding protein